jgi:MFS family permease
MSGSPRRVFALALCLFVFVNLNRASLGVAGPLAESRFGIGPGGLTGFLMLQVGVYAVFQVPAGVLVDRIGPRRALVAAGLVNGAAQLLFGLSQSYGVALLARFVLGCADSLVFISVLRVAATAVSGRRYPKLVALTQLGGLAGGLTATLPLLLLLRSAGWAATFCGVGAVTMAVAAVLGGGRRETAPAPAGPWDLVGAIRSAWQRPATRLACWLQVSCNSVAMAFLLLWGFPYLTRGAGLDDDAAGAVLLAAVLVCAAVMPLAGLWFSRHPRHRVASSSGVIAAGLALWAVVLVWGESPPDALVAGALLISVAGIPAAGAAFAIVRDGVETGVMSTATGIVNAGGYLATVLACVGAGAVLQLSGDQDPNAYRLAVAAMMAVPAVGLIRVAAWSRRTGRATAQGLEETTHAAACPSSRA